VEHAKEDLYPEPMMENLSKELRKIDSLDHSRELFSEKWDDIKQANIMEQLLTDANSYVKEGGESGKLVYKNVLYHRLVHNEEIEDDDTDATLLMVERPEAHLHISLEPAGTLCPSARGYTTDGYNSEFDRSNFSFRTAK